MKRSTRGFVAAIAAAALVPIGGLGSPANAADGPGCVKSMEFTDDPASYSDTFNASADCNGVWAITSLNWAITVKGQYFKDGVWINSSLKAKSVDTSIGHEQIVGQTVGGRRLRAHRVGGAAYDYVQYKY